MLKRFLCLLLCFLLAVFPLCLPASAAGIEDVLIEIIIEACQHYGAAATSNIESMSGDEFVEFWTDRTNFDANGLTALMHAAQYKVGLEGGVTIRSDAFDQLGLSRGAYLNKALIHRDLINDIIDLVNSGGVLDYLSSDSYGLYTSFPVDYVNWSTFGTPLKLYEGTSNYELWGGYIAQSCSTGRLTVIHFTNLPPAIYAGSGAVVTHHGYNLPTGKLYFIADQDCLIPAAFPNYNYSETYGALTNAAGISLRSTPNTIYSNGTLYTISKYGRYYSNSDLYHFDSSGSAVTSYIRDGVSVDLSYSSSDHLALYQALAYRSGSFLSIDDTPISPVSVPDNLPSDDDGNVVMLIPQGGGDIIYLSPTDYDNYVTNNDIDETTYNDTLNQTTINNIHNIIGDSDSDSDSDSGSGSSGGGGSFDDTRILGKLDTIIGLLRDIKGIMTLTFNTEPCYDNFFDCFDGLSSSLLNGQLLSDSLLNISEDQPVVVLGAAPRASSSKSPEPSRAYDQGGAGGGNSVDLIASSVGQFDGFVIDLSWYLDFRPYVFSVFTLIAYAVGLYSIVKSYKSVFGISTFSMGSELAPFLEKKR